MPKRRDPSLSLSCTSYIHWYWYIPAYAFSSAVLVGKKLVEEREKNTFLRTGCLLQAGNQNINMLT